MVRRRDKLKADVRKYFDFKNIKSWEGYNNTLPLENNWDEAIEEHRRKGERREQSARRIQESWREKSIPGWIVTRALFVPRGHGTIWKSGNIKEIDVEI